MIAPNSMPSKRLKTAPVMRAWTRRSGTCSMACGTAARASSVMPLATSEPTRTRERSMLRRNCPSRTALRMAPPVAGPRITYESWAAIPITWLTYAGASVKSMKRTRTAMLTWPKASIRPRDARSASRPSLISVIIRRNRLRLLHRRIGGALKSGDVGGKDQRSGHREERRRHPVRRIEIDARQDRRQRAADDKGEHHGEQRHRVGGDQRRTRQDGRNHRCLRRREQLADRREDEGDEQQVKKVVPETGDEGGQRDKRDRSGPPEVGPHHDQLAVHPVRDHPRGRREHDSGHRVREQGDRHRCAAAGDLEREDDQ